MHSIPVTRGAGRRLGGLARLTALPAAFFGLLLLWQERARERNHLSRLDRRLLKDVGLSPEQVDHESSKPFWRG